MGITTDDRKIYEQDKAKCPECDFTVKVSVLAKGNLVIEQVLIHIGTFTHLLAEKIHERPEVLRFAPALLCTAACLWRLIENPDLPRFVDLCLKWGRFHS